jgi:hypothetical protein
MSTGLVAGWVAVGAVWLARSAQLVSARLVARGAAWSSVPADAWLRALLKSPWHAASLAHALLLGVCLVLLAVARVAFGALSENESKVCAHSDASAAMHGSSGRTPALRITAIASCVSRPLSLNELTDFLSRHCFSILHALFIFRPVHLLVAFLLPEEECSACARPPLSLSRCRW